MIPLADQHEISTTGFILMISFLWVQPTEPVRSFLVSELRGLNKASFVSNQDWFLQFAGLPGRNQVCSVAVASNDVENRIQKRQTGSHQRDTFADWVTMNSLFYSPIVAPTRRRYSPEIFPMPLVNNNLDSNYQQV